MEEIVQFCVGLDVHRDTVRRPTTSKGNARTRRARFPRTHPRAGCRGGDPGGDGVHGCVLETGVLSARGPDPGDGAAERGAHEECARPQNRTSPIRRGSPSWSNPASCGPRSCRRRSGSCGISPGTAGPWWGNAPGAIQRLEKILQDAGIKLSSVASMVLTKSGRAILEAMLAGQNDPAVLADLSLGRLRSKIPQLRNALAGSFRVSQHGVLVRQMTSRQPSRSTVYTRIRSRPGRCRLRLRLIGNPRGHRGEFHNNPSTRLAAGFPMGGQLPATAARRACENRRESMVSSVTRSRSGSPPAGETPPAALQESHGDWMSTVKIPGNRRQSNVSGGAVLTTVRGVSPVYASRQRRSSRGCGPGGHRRRRGPAGEPADCPPCRSAPPSGQPLATRPRHRRPGRKS